MVVPLVTAFPMNMLRIAGRQRYPGKLPSMLEFTERSMLLYHLARGRANRSPVSSDVSAARYQPRGTAMRRSSSKPMGIYRSLMLLVASAFLIPLYHGVWSAEP